MPAIRTLNYFGRWPPMCNQLHAEGKEEKKGAPSRFPGRFPPFLPPAPLLKKEGKKRKKESAILPIPYFLLNRRVKELHRKEKEEERHEGAARQSLPNPSDLYNLIHACRSHEGLRKSERDP